MKSMWSEDRYTQSKNEKMFILIKKTCSLHMTGSFYGCLLKRQWTILASSNITYIWRMLVALHSSAHSSCICMQLLAVWTAAGSRIYYCFKYLKKCLTGLSGCSCKSQFVYLALRLSASILVLTPPRQHVALQTNELFYSQFTTLIFFHSLHGGSFR